MSTQGEAVVLAAPIALPALAITGLVVLGVQAIHGVYVHQQQKAQAAWQQDQMRRIAESARTQETHELAQQRAMQRWRARNPTLSMPSPIEAAAITQQAQQAQAQIKHDSQALERLRREVALERARADLTGAIESAEALLPAAMLAKIRAALTSSSADQMQAAIGTIEHELQQQNDQRAVVAQATQEARRLLREAQSQLAEANRWLLASASLNKQMLRTVTQRLAAVSARIEANPAGARDQLRPALVEIEDLRRNIASGYTSEWQQMLSEASAQGGRLTALNTILSETQANQAGVSGNAAERLRGLKKTLDQWMATSGEFGANLTEARARLAKISARLDSATEEVFEEIGQRQQEVAARTISETLGELGFVKSMVSKSPPQVALVGRKLQIVGTRQQPGGSVQNEELVSFYVNQDGSVAYDFSGYKGESCTQAAREIFEALRKKGLVLVQAETAQHLNGSSVSLTREQVDRYPLPTFDVNLRQARLHQRLRQVLQKMQFQHIQEQVAGGSIILEAFNGDVGYHVVLHSDSDLKQPKVLRTRGQQQEDVSNDASDAVVSEMLREPATPVRAKRKPWYRTAQQAAGTTSARTALSGEH